MKKFVFRHHAYCFVTLGEDSTTLVVVLVSDRDVGCISGIAEMLLPTVLDAVGLREKSLDNSATETFEEVLLPGPPSGGALLNILAAVAANENVSVFDVEGLGFVKPLAGRFG